MTYPPCKQNSVSVFLIAVVTCDKIDVPFMTFDPPTNDLHVFDTTIEYSCVVGYNHSHGDLNRTCNYTGEWTGSPPNCTSIERLS